MAFITVIGAGQRISLLTISLDNQSFMQALSACQLLLKFKRRGIQSQSYPKYSQKTPNLFDLQAIGRSVHTPRILKIKSFDLYYYRVRTMLVWLAMMFDNKVR